MPLDGGDAAPFRFHRYRLDALRLSTLRTSKGCGSHVTASYGLFQRARVGQFQFLLGVLLG